MKTRHMRQTGAALAALAPLLAGCYRYLPVRPDEVPVGTSVRAHLSDAAASRMEAALPIANRSIEGKVLQRGANELFLSVSVRDRQTLTDRALLQRVSIPQTEIVALELKEIDQVKTGALVAGVGAGVTALLIKALSGRTENTSRPDGGGPQEIVVPLFTIRHR